MFTLTLNDDLKGNVPSVLEKMSFLHGENPISHLKNDEQQALSIFA